MQDQIGPWTGDDRKSIAAAWTEHSPASIYGREAVLSHNHPYVVLHDLDETFIIDSNSSQDDNDSNTKHVRI